MIPQEQGSVAWLEYRRNKLGGSDAAACLGISPWMTTYELFLEKTGKGMARYVSPAMARGIALEEEARKAYESLTGYIVFPEVIQHPIFDWAIASLDGLTIARDIAVEIKCPNAETHAKTADGIIEPHYMAQLQHQMWVLGHKYIDYFSYDGVTTHLITVFRDEKFINKMVDAELKMIECIRTNTPPPMTEKDMAMDVNAKAKADVVDLSQDEEWTAWENSYNYFKIQADGAENSMKAIKHKMEEYAAGRNVKGMYSRFTKIVRPGAIDYSKVAELQGVNLDAYRKEAVVSYRITLDKEE